MVTPRRAVVSDVGREFDERIQTAFTHASHAPHTFLDNYSSRTAEPEKASPHES